jgi:hypothetical protein
VTKRQEALANINELACIGVQAIEAQKARRVWLDAKAAHQKLLRAYYEEIGEDYSGEAVEESDLEIDKAMKARQEASGKKTLEARKLRSMVNRYQAGLK